MFCHVSPIQKKKRLMVGKVTENSRTSKRWKEQLELGFKNRRMKRKSRSRVAHFLWEFCFFSNRNVLGKNVFHIFQVTEFVDAILAKTNMAHRHGRFAIVICDTEKQPNGENTRNMYEFSGGTRGRNVNFKSNQDIHFIASIWTALRSTTSPCCKAFVIRQVWFRLFWEMPPQNESETQTTQQGSGWTRWRKWLLSPFRMESLF